jgi:threonine/homoserine/homoserine lactone efflux protein
MALVLTPSARTGSGRTSFAQCFAVGVTNPKTVVFLAAILPQFVTRSAGNVAAQILALGLIFAVIAVAPDLVSGRSR